MPIDPRRLRPSELARLLNSTPLGTVIDERQLYRHRTRAGYRVGDGKHVDLFRYTAWLVSVRHEPKTTMNHRRGTTPRTGRCDPPLALQSSSLR